MIKDITSPLAQAVVCWVTPDMGGRRSGPPAAPVYAATTVPVPEDDDGPQPGWPIGENQTSILIQRTATLPGGAWLCKIDFLARDIAELFVRPGAAMLVMEGPKVVATAVVTTVQPR